MANQKMGFEGQLFIGTAGAQATTTITNAQDISYNLDHEKGNTTVRGDGSAIPIQTESVTLRTVSIEWTMIHDTTDTDLETIRSAAYAGSSLAIRTKDYASGKGFDGDCTISVQDGRPLAGEATLQFTATPTLDNGRTPQLYT
jgi:hypothetical protein